MSILTLPAACALQLAGFSLGQQRFDITEQSDGNGNTATRLGAPPRWRASLRSLPAMVAADSARWKSLQLGLRGRINHLALWDITNPQPRGTARGTLTTSGSLAIGATAVTLAGAIGGNYILNGSFEIDSNADGLADRWTRYSSGAAGALTHSRSTGVAITAGVYSQHLVAASLGATSADQQGIFGALQSVPALAGKTVTVSCTALGTAGAMIGLQVAWLDSGGGGLGAITSPGLLLTGADQQLSVTGACPAGAVNGVIYVYQHSGPGGAVGLYVDRVRVEVGSSVNPAADYATLLAGDWLQISTGVGSHYCMVTADATATDAGAITVTVEPPVRQAITSGTVVAWDKPLCHYKQTADAASWDAVPGSSDVGGFQLDLIEDWRA